MRYLYSVRSDTKKLIIINGGLAQLARAFDWQSKGHRFDSGTLHPQIKAVMAFMLWPLYLLH